MGHYGVTHDDFDKYESGEVDDDGHLLINATEYEDLQYYPLPNILKQVIAPGTY